jgi:hypothetical protein
MRVIAGGRAIPFEVKSVTSDNITLKGCINVIRNGKLDRTKGWAGKRASYLQRCGYSSKCIEVCTSNQKIIRMSLQERDSKLDATETWGRIQSSSYFPMYKTLWTSEIPEYFKLKSEMRKTLARYRCGNESQNWINKECIRCSSPFPNLDHVFLCFNIDKPMLELLSSDGRCAKEVRMTKR